MISTLIDDNYLINRRYYNGSIDGGWHARPMILEIPHHLDFFNGFSIKSQAQLSALTSFGEQVEKHLDKLQKIDPEDLAISFSKMLHALLEINASAIFTQITSFNSFVIKAETAKANVYIELFFDEATGWLNETVVNIFHSNQLDFNNSGSLEAMILAIKQYFGNEERDYITYLNQTNEYSLSGTAFTPVEF